MQFPASSGAVLIPLHVKSHYSRAAGTASLEQLVARAAQHGLPALALTDVDNLSGQPRFHELCRNAGIRPITGVELRRRGKAPSSRAGRLVLLARDATGYANLCRIVSAHHRQDRCDPAALLAGEARGLFVLTDDPATLERVLAAGLVDPTNLRLLLVRPSSRDEGSIRAAAARFGVPLIADPEIAMLDADDLQFHALLTAAHGNRRISALSSSDLESPDRWFRPPTNQIALFADLPGAVDETVRIAEQCQFRLARGRPVLPGADAFDNADPERVLDARCREALRAGQRRDRLVGPAYVTRLDEELAIIRELGYASYFLIAAELAEVARRRDVALTARGSAVGSLVVHLLGVSPIDPLAHGLYFERFLHAHRRSPPDIDLDVCSARRDELIRWLCRRFGRERVARVGTLPSFQFDTAVRSGLWALGAQPEQIERFAAAITRLGAQADNEARHIPAAALDALPSKLSQAVPLLGRLIGKPRSLAMHPGGIVVADRTIAAHVPVERGRDGLWVAQYDQRSIEQTGLTKLDLLGNRFSSQLQRTRALTRGAAPRLHECPTADAATLARIARAETLGCFQIETPLLRAVLRQVRVRSLEDCAAALALVRPGPRASTAKRAYLIGPERPPLYDEDLLASLSAHAGIDLAGADELRARIIDCDSPRELAVLEREYLERARHSHRDLGLARAAFHQATRFAAYSFCKAHALSYALLAYQSAYLATHHRVEWGCALLDDYGGAYPLRTIAAALSRSGVTIAAPSINRSSIASTVDANGTIVLGLSRIKHLHKKTARAIVAARERRGELTSMRELCGQVRVRPQELRALVLSGACDELQELAADAYPFAHHDFLRARGLADHRPSRPRPGADPRRLADYRALTRIRHELEYLEMHVTAHPMRVLRDQARRSGCLTLAEAQVAEPGSSLRFAGLIAASRRHRSARGIVEYLTFEDESGLLDAVLAPELFPRFAPIVTTPGPYLGEGRLRDDHGHRFVQIAALCPFHERHLRAHRGTRGDARTSGA